MPTKQRQPRPTPGVRFDRSLLPNTTGSPILRFLLTAREGGLWVDRLRQGINSALGRHFGGGRCRVPSHQSRGGWHSLIPPKVAPFYAAANRCSVLRGLSA